MKALSELFEFLQKPRNIVIVSHARPDGDAIGSSLSLQLYLQKKNHTVSIIVPDAFPEFLNWLPGSNSIYIHQKKSKTCFAILTRADIIFCLDFNSIKRIDELGNDILKLHQPVKKVLIDHHRDPDEFTDFSLWNVEASSTAELIYDFIVMNHDEHMIDTDIAACIYCGMATDTGLFQYSNTTAKVHTIAGFLIEKGINIEHIHNSIYNQFGENRLRFIGYILSEKLVILEQYTTAYMSITMQEAERFKLGTGDKEGIVNLPLAMKNVDMAVLFTEDKGKVKISFRSKENINVDAFARTYFNGGGHKNAAGGSTKISLIDTITYFQKVLPDFINSSS